MQVLSNLAIDAWYKLVMWLGATVLVLGLTVPLQVPTRAAIVFGLGALVFGLGQWINHPLQTRICVGGMTTSYNRLPGLGGRVAEIAGAGLAGWGLWLMLSR